MNRNVPVFCLLVWALAAGMGCGRKPAADQAKNAAAAPDRIQGKAQVLIEGGGALDATLNAGSSNSLYVWEGVRRYRLFLKTPFEATHGKEYIVEGVNAQRVIDEIGDPDQGQNGYPLLASCRKVITTAWKNLPLDVIDLNAQTLRNRINRYPARPIFLVTRIQPVEAAPAKEGEKKEKEPPEVTVPAAKQAAFLILSPGPQTAPLWAPKADKETCKVVIGPDGKIAELETGRQLCEFVNWSGYKYQPPVQAGKPVKVSTEVEVKFQPLKPTT